jgi:glycosidase
MRTLFIIFISVVFLTACNSSKEAKTNTPVFSDEFLSKAVIYEVNVRQYTQEGTFYAFAAYLPKLKELGIDILWFMPIHPIGIENRKGSLGSYYSIRDYRGINPEFGTLEDFKSLVDAAHDLDILVMIDLVAGHTAWDHPWIAAHPEWYLKDDQGNIIPPNPDWTDVAGLNFENQDMLQALEDDMAYWVAEVGVDGYRCDAAYNISIPFWKKAMTRLNSIKPVVMLAESDGNHKGGYPLIELFQLSYDWPGHATLNRIAKGEMKAIDLKNHLKSVQQNYSSDHAVMSFTTNHDENSWNGTVFERLGDAAEVMAVLTYAMPGTPLIYSGQEYGLDKRLEFFEKDLIPKKESSYMTLFTKLNTLKKTSDALDVGKDAANINLLENSNADVIAFSRKKGDDTLIFVGNLSNVPQQVSLADNSTYTDVFTEKEVQINNLNLESWSYRLVRN